MTIITNHPKKESKSKKKKPDIGSLRVKTISSSNLFELSSETTDNLDELSTEGLVQMLHKIGSSKASNKTKTLNVIQHLQQRIFNENFILPHYFKQISIFCIVIWTLLCAIITTVWCLWFDGTLNVANQYQNEIALFDECDGDIIPLKTMINYNTSQTQMDQMLFDFEQNGNSFYQPPSGDAFDSSYGADDARMAVSTRFLLCVLLSYVLSVFLWQPLFIAIQSLIQTLRLNPLTDKIDEGTLFCDIRKYLGTDTSQNEVLNESGTQNIELGQACCAADDNESHSDTIVYSDADNK